MVVPRLLNPLRAGLCLLATLLCAAAQGGSRVNVAKYQTCAADSFAAGEPASFATDGNTGNGNRWKSDPNRPGPHWLSVTLPLPMEIGSAQLFLGRDDIEPITTFSLQYKAGASWVTIPGTAFTNTTNTVFNLVFTSPIVAAEFRLLTADAVARVREIALYPPNGAEGFPLGTDLTLNLAKKRPATASSVEGLSVAKGAVDGYDGNDQGRWKSGTGPGPFALEIDLQESSRLGSSHLYLGSTGNPTITNLVLESWNGSSWIPIPGGTVTGNTRRELALRFSTVVTTSRIRLNIPDPGPHRVREWTVFAAASGPADYPLGTDVTAAAPPSTRFDTYGDGFWSLDNQGMTGSLTAGRDGSVVKALVNSDITRQFEVLYNLDSDTFRLRSRDTWLCLEASAAGRTAGTAVVEGSRYSAMPHQLWRIQDAGNGRVNLVNVWNQLALDSDAQGKVFLSTNANTARQQWKLSYMTHYPKKGTGGYEGDWSKFRSSWSYNWGRDTGAALPDSVVFTPMQHNRWWPDWGTLGESYSPWHVSAKPVALLGFNEPEKSDQGNISVADAIALWPNLEQSDIPLVSPSPVTPYDGWLGDFYTQANAKGYRVDFTALHWYANPDASGLINFLQGVYNTWGKPIWLTEFSPVDWGGNATWTEEDNYRFLSEFLWRAEDLLWLKRYAVFSFNDAPTSNPWDKTGPTGSVFNGDGKTFTSYGELYASWDGDRSLRGRTAYYIQGLDSMHRLRASSTTNALSFGDIRRSDVSTQWALIPAATSGRWHIVSLRDGRRLRFTGSLLELSPPGTTGALVEWTFNGPDSSGYTFIDHPATSKSLRLKRTSAANGTPTSLDIGMEPFGTVVSATRWRFIKPYQPAEITPPPAPTQLQAQGEVGHIVLNWTASLPADFLSYTVYRRLGTNSSYTPIATRLTQSSWSDTNVTAGTSYRYAVASVDWLDAESALSGEIESSSKAPALDVRFTSAPHGTTLTVTWPVTTQSFRLQTSPSLTTPITWTALPGAARTGSLWTQELPVSAEGARFFRLVSP